MAKARVGALHVLLSATTKPFERSMKRAQSHVRGFATSIASMSWRMAKWGAVLGGGAIIGGLTVLTKKGMDAVDEIGKLSDILDISTTDLAGFQYAAEIAGGSTEGLNKALSIFTRRLGEVRMGTGEAQDGLEAIGLAADDLVNLDTGDAIRLIADEINKLPTAADRAAVAYKLLGRGGMAMMNMILSGSKGIEASLKRFRQLGGAFSREDAALVEEFKDRWLDVKTIFTNLGRQLAIKTAPYLTYLVNKFTDVATAG